MYGTSAELNAHNLSPVTHIYNLIAHSLCYFLTVKNYLSDACVQRVRRWLTQTAVRERGGNDRKNCSKVSEISFKENLPVKFWGTH
jgi:hypothetical protein